MKVPLSAMEKRLSIQAPDQEKIPAAQAARVLMIDRTEFRLAPEQWEAFCERLDAPPQAIPALQRLFDEPEPY